MPTDFAGLLGAIIAAALWVYALSAGADFGGGVWDLLAHGPRKQQQRDLIAHAVGPIWEANHVWMVLVVVLLFVAFPVAFAAIMTALHLPVVAMLVGMTLRGAAFVFRAYAPASGGWSRWGSIFGAASIGTPVLLGVILGAVISGRIRLDAHRLVETDFVSEWLAPFPWGLGLMVLALFGYLAATYLAVEARDAALQADFCRMAMAANVCFGLLAGLTAWAARHGAPHLWPFLAGTPTAWAMQLLTAAVAFVALAALAQRRVRTARAAAVAQVSLVVACWVAAQGRWLLPGQLSLDEALAPSSIVRPVLWALFAGALVLGPSFVWLYRVFKRR
jgi:cytochrome d ubiquinol oxidase subunit II